MKKIGLVLGAGGAKGLAHLGVLRVLAEEGIPIHLLAGSSIGAFCGAIYASGSPMDKVEKLAILLNQKQLVDLQVPKMGLIGGEKVLELIRLLTQNKTFDQLDLPLAVVATDIEKGEKVVFREGPVAEAIRASVSIPGIFQPYPYGGRLLVDGAVLDRLPIEVCRGMGADRIIAVDLKGESSANSIGSIFDVILTAIDLLEREAGKGACEGADVLIQPDVEGIGTTSFDKAEMAIEAGVRAAKEALPRIRQVIAGE